jgi:alpha-amylase
VMERTSRPGQYELLGIDDAPPYRIFWRPPPDLAAEETVSFIATADDLRGHRVAARASGINADTSGLAFGIEGAVVPSLSALPPPAVAVRLGEKLSLAVTATGTPELEFQWFKDGVEIRGATDSHYQVDTVMSAHAGRYTVTVRNRAGTVIMRETVVEITSR